MALGGFRSLGQGGRPADTSAHGVQSCEDFAQNGVQINGGTWTETVCRKQLRSCLPVPVVPSSKQYPQGKSRRLEELCAISRANVNEFELIIRHFEALHTC